MALLTNYPLTHAAIKPVMNPELNVEVCGQTAVHYARFARPVRLERLDLPRHGYGRNIPAVPVHPAHLIISVLDAVTNRWKTVKEVHFPLDPRIAGEGLSQDMPYEKINEHFRLPYRDPPLSVDLGGIETDHLRIECDREHPVWSNHGECNGPTFAVPFGILNPIGLLGETLSAEPGYAPYLPILKLGVIRPRAPRGMNVRRRLESILFQGKKLSVAFSLRRPMVMHLGWDGVGGGHAHENRLMSKRSSIAATGNLRGTNGPTIRTLWSDYGPHLWSGEVSIDGNRIRYRNLKSAAGIKLDATFTVEADRLLLSLTQSSDCDVPVLEAEAWRFVFDLRKGMTAAAAQPTLKPGRNGDVQLPMAFAGDGNGCLFIRQLDGPAQRTHMQIESYRPQSAVAGGFVLGDRPAGDEAQVVPKGKITSIFELRVGSIGPASRGSKKLSPGLQKHWGSVFSCFRPELGGFSNNAASVHCHLSQSISVELASMTRQPKIGADPLELARFTTTRALLGHGGYGYWRNLYLDTDPVLLSCAGRIHQVRPDMTWLRRVEPGIVAAAGRMLGTMSDEGLAICRDLSGNSGTYRWSSNAMDCVGFGHMDAYVNTWTYRGLRNATALLTELGRRDLADRCRDAAAALPPAFERELINPDTGWIVGWRSRDGQLHDMAPVWINGPACAFGVISKSKAKRALQQLEKLREKLGINSARLGVPLSLLPTDPKDHFLPTMGMGFMEPTFEVYTDGCLSPCGANYYLRALSICGLKDRARKIADELDEGFAENAFHNGNFDGVEFIGWEGSSTGYEGTFGPVHGSLYGIAVEKGYLVPPSPEWWPEGG